MSGHSISRRHFLKTLGVGILSAGIAAGCSGNSAPLPAASAGAKSTARSLKVLQQTHFVPAFDEWFDKDHTQKWGQTNSTAVSVDHLPLASIYPKAASEAAARAGHDIVGFIAPPAVFENEVVDVTDVIQELEKRLGPMVPLARKSCYNPKTKKWIGVPDFWAPMPTIWRKDLWEEAEPGAKPNTWDDLLRVGRKLKQKGYPLGIGLSADLDSNCGLRGLLYTYGASLQDASSKVTINSPQTIEALKMGAAIFKETMSPEVLSWSASSNNNFILSGSGSLVFNALSALRTIEKKKPDLAKNIFLAQFPGGPARQVVPTNIMNVYSIWKFSPNIDLAKKFLIDLILAYETAFSKSESYNLPAFPGSVKNIQTLLSKDAVAVPADKYALMINAEQWTTNYGEPGTSNAGEMEVLDTFIIPKMFALVAQDMMSAADAAKWAESAVKPIFEKWQGRGLI
jgi:multiple sugar transport system substrate-binding protein